MGGIFNLVNLHVYHYAGNNPVKYVDPDGRDSVAVLNFAKGVFGAAAIATQVDSPIPGPGDVVGAGILAVGVVTLGVAGVLALSEVISKTKTKEQPSTRLFHYSTSPVWKGELFSEGGYLTDDPAMTSQEARSKLALPNVAEEQQLYLYTLEIKPGDVTMPRPVAPKESNITGEVLPGGGTEYQATRPLPMSQGIGIPVRND
jgi:hypothetical protein